MNSKINTWIDAIINEDGHKLSDGSLRTLQMIKNELSKVDYKPICPKVNTCRSHSATIVCPEYDVICPL